MADGKLVYYGEIKVADGKYTKDGVEKTRYVTLGKLYHSPHLSRVSIYLNPTAVSDGKWINAYPHQEYEKPTEPISTTPRQADNVVDIDDKPITLDDIPF